MNSIDAHVDKLKRDKVRIRRIVAALCIISLIVAAGVFWQLRLVGVSKTSELSCGVTEHRHDESCGATRVLVCKQAERAGTPQLVCGLPEHTHTPDCYETVQELICTETDAAHKHDESCYELRQTLVCGLAEHTHGDTCWLPAAEHVHTEECYETVYACGMEEHEHTIACYSDLGADLETESDWVDTLPTELSGMRQDDLVRIAKSQVGYTESERNYILAQDGKTIRNYSRYGEWYGNPYGNWDVMFASFCLYYAQISQNEFPYASGATTWAAALQDKGLYQNAGSYLSQAGDVVFLNMQPEGEKNHVGIVTKVSPVSIETVEGDMDGRVIQSDYELTDSRILGYGQSGLVGSRSADSNTEWTRIMTHDGPDYSVMVSLTEDAQIPETAELSVREIERSSTEYSYYFQQTVSAMQLDTVPAFCRFFDVSFVNDGTVIEPAAPVDVTITYADALPIVDEEKCTAVHFAEDGLELLDTQVEAAEQGDAVTFTQDSFSVVGTVIKGTVSLTNGSKYVFYTGDGYALGVTYDAVSGYQVGSVEINIGNNGYIKPDDSTLDIDNISWIYSSTYGLYSPAAGKYLQFIATTPQVVPRTLDYTSTLGLMSGTASVTSKVINNSVRLLTEYYNRPYDYTGAKDFMLAYESGQFMSGTSFNSAQTYLLTANVVTVSDALVDPGSLEVIDDIRESGCIKPQLNAVLPGTTDDSVYTYVWEKSTDDGARWDDVVRKKITGESYNVASDGSWLNVALDKGAEAQYRVSLVAVDGATLDVPIQAKVYHVQYFDSLKNGDFESPVVPKTDNAADYQPFLSNGTYGMVWKTTAADGQIEYVSISQEIYANFGELYHQCRDADSGVQFVELNATQEGALYQDVLTVPGSTMYWQLSHRARGMRYMSGERDTMHVVIMSTKMAEEYDITTQNKVKDVVNNPGKYPGAVVKTIENDNLKWYIERGKYDVPEDQYLSRYFFVTGDTASNDTSVGNHLDSVSFSIELPPIAPDKTNVMVEKRIAGLSYDDAYELLAGMRFSIYDVTNAVTVKEVTVSDLGLLEDNGDGTYSANYTAQALTPGRYAVYENTNGGIADKSGYIRTTTVSSVNGAGESSFLNGYYMQEVNAPAMGTASVTFLNSYARKTDDVTLLKNGSDGQALSAGFELAVKEVTGWTVVSADVRTTGGQAVLSSLIYDTLYRLTETAVPDGYVGQSAPFYFMVTENGIKFYNATGTTEVTAPDGVTASDSPATGKTITVVNRAGFVLPDSGGAGTLLFTVAGLMLMTCPIMIICVLRRKRERRENN